MLLSIVIPCYKSAHTIGKVVEMTMEVAAGEGLDCEFILVNDCSPDDTYQAILRLAEKYPNVKGIDFAKNFGQHNAIMAGLRLAKGDYIMGMDDDMQTHPSQIPAFIRKMDEGYDVVFGIYKKRKFGILKNMTSKVASFIVWHMVERPKGLEASNFWCCRKYVRDEIIKYNGYNLYLQILFYRTTSHIANIEILHFSREEGSSNYNFRKAFRLFMSFLNYTVIPLRVAVVMGTLFSAAGFLGAAAVLAQKLLNPNVAIGWSSLMCAMLIFFGITFLMLGVIGEYVGKLILNQNRTPQYVIRETVNTGEEEMGEEREKDGPAL
ncbi:MAG: glycosyltransferase family 2 protein [Eubacteriales bacterium]|nr:glycosyltransferase family 2 protein [Eubacteriales bacterium]